MGPKTHKADSQFEKLCRKTDVLLACSEPNCSKYDLMAGLGHTESLAPPLRIRLDGPPFNWPPIHTMKVYTSLPIGRTAAWKVKNGLKATSHQKLATDGASPELIPTRTNGL